MQVDDKLMTDIIDVVCFYGNAETYSAIGFFPDPPNGEFMDDFGDSPQGFKPGKRAREILKRIVNDGRFMEEFDPERLRDHE